MNLFLWDLKILSNYCGKKNGICSIGGQVIQDSPLIVSVNLSYFRILTPFASQAWNACSYSQVRLHCQSCLVHHLLKEPSWTRGGKHLPYWPSSCGWAGWCVLPFTKRWRVWFQSGNLPRLRVWFTLFPPHKATINVSLINVFLSLSSCLKNKKTRFLTPLSSQVASSPLPHPAKIPLNFSVIYICFLVYSLSPWLAF